MISENFDLATVGLRDSCQAFRVARNAWTISPHRSLFLPSNLSGGSKQIGDTRQNQKSEPIIVSSLFLPNGVKQLLIGHMRRRLQVLIDRGVAFPLVDEPVAHAELETEFFHVT